MWILAFEFSSDRRAVAVVGRTTLSGQKALMEHQRFGQGGLPPVAPAYGEWRVAGTASEQGGRQTHALGMAEAALKDAGIEREAVDVIAIGIGPGSYTGIRIALATAQGWQLGTGVKTIGVGSVDCLAEQARREGLRGRVHMAVDAQRGEFYHAVYRVTDTAWTLEEPLRITAADTILAARAPDEALIGPDAVVETRLNGRRVFPDAAILGQLAASRTDFAPAFQIEPIYLRAVSFVKAPPARVVPGLTPE